MKTQQIERIFEIVKELHDMDLFDISSEELGLKSLSKDELRVLKVFSKFVTQDLAKIHKLIVKELYPGCTRGNRE
jgi:hypothetical protein